VLVAAGPDAPSIAYVLHYSGRGLHIHHLLITIVVVGVVKQLHLGHRGFQNKRKDGAHCEEEIVTIDL
jgi:hypothetical protein